MDIIQGQVNVSYDDSAMVFIVNAYIREKIDPSVFIDRQYEAFVRKIQKGYPFGEEGLLKKQIQYAITGLTHFCLNEKDLVEKAQEGRLLDYLFDYVIKTPYAQTLINSAESVHIQYDPHTGETKPVTLN